MWGSSSIGRGPSPSGDVKAADQPSGRRAPARGRAGHYLAGLLVGVLGILSLAGTLPDAAQAATKRRSKRSAATLAASAKSTPAGPADLGLGPVFDAGVGGRPPPPAAVPTPPITDAGTRSDAASPAVAAIGSSGPPSPTAPGAATEPQLPPSPMPQIKEEQPATPATAAATDAGGKKNKRAKTPRAKPVKIVPTDVLLESQNHYQAIARRYAQLLSSGRYDEARLMHEEEGGRRPDWSGVRTAVRAFSELHGSASDVEQNLVTWTGAELLTFFFTAHYKDGSELPIRVALDHHGNVSGAGVGSELVAATKKRYDRNDNYKTHNVLSLPFYGTWVVSNATLAAGNGHYLNANQRFAIDFYITDEVEPGKRKSHRDRGKQNVDYFAFGQDVLAPADGTVLMVVDGIPDNLPGQVDIYYRLGNSVVISLGNGEYAHLCHLQNGSMQVRVGDKVTRGQVVAKCGNSGNSTAPHLHFQLTDAPLISHAASLPAYFSGILKDGVRQASVLPQSGDRLTNPAQPSTPKGAPEHPAPP